MLAGVCKTSGETVQIYIKQHCRATAQREKNRIIIQYLVDVTHQTLAYNVTPVAGTSAPHTVTKPHLDLALRRMQPTLFNWCEGMVANVKEQITKMKRVRLINFDYGSLLVSFIF